MSTKALKSQLVAAIAMTLVAAIALGSSTFAWFAANNSVTANNMTVTATTDAKFLEIRNSTGSFSGSSLAVNAVTADPGKTLFPATIATVDTTKPTISQTVSWKYAYSNDVAVSTRNGDFISIDEANIGDYVLTNTFYVRTTVDTTTLTNLKLTGVTLTWNDTTPAATIGTDSIDEAVRVLVVGESGYQIWDCGTKAFADEYDNPGTSTSTHNLINTVAYTNSTTGGQWLNVYVYYDGEDARLFTNNLNTMKGVTVNLTFAGT